MPSRGWSESQLSQRNNSLLLGDSATALPFDAKWFSSSPRVNICLMQSFLSQFRPPRKRCLEALLLLRAGPMRWDCNKMCSDTTGPFRPRTCMKQKWPHCASSWWAAQTETWRAHLGEERELSPSLGMWPFSTWSRTPRRWTACKCGRRLIFLVCFWFLLRMARWG